MNQRIFLFRGGEDDASTMIGGVHIIGGFHIIVGKVRWIREGQG